MKPFRDRGQFNAWRKSLRDVAAETDRMQGTCMVFIGYHPYIYDDLAGPEGELIPFAPEVSQRSAA